MASTSTWTRLIRFIAKEDGQTHLGAVDAAQYPDFGLSVVNGERVVAPSFLLIKINNDVLWLLAPIDMEDVPLIRCMGLNYRDRAKEANMPIPDAPVLFVRPRTALNGPHPAMDYVLGYTCSNDASARTQQFKNSQWSFSKGPVLVAPFEVDPHQLDIKAIHNGSVVQDSNTR
ncbi:hypothetical protein BDW66DRAFT_150453 [Aspergillus desertorum]